MEQEIIIKHNKTIKEALRKRFDELNLTYPKISSDAESFGITSIDPYRLSRYFNNSELNNLSDEGVQYLCAKYCIVVELKVEILPYDEKVGIKNVKKLLKGK